MLRTMLKAKIQDLRLTATNLECEGSIGLDQDLLDRADILPGEQVDVLNRDNGQRLTTYTIAAPRGSGEAALYGPAARLGEAGQTVFVLAYCQLEDGEARKHRATIVKVGENNKPK